MNENENGIIVSNQVVEMVPLSYNTVLNDIEENGLEMWNHCITNEFPICEVIRKGNEVILNIGSPHKGFVIESVMNEGKLNGKAIMKNDKGVLIGEFVYVNGEANGSCKLYNENGVLYFEGYLKNGYREGIGKEYDLEGNVIFEGIFVKGNRKKGLRIEDDYMIEYDEEGNRIIGYKVNDKCEKNGICYLYKDNKVCEVWKYDNNEKVCILIELKGNEMMEYNEDGGVIYRGGYMESKKYRYIRNGFGIEYDDDGNKIYEGYYWNDRRHGKGISSNNNNKIYDGIWYKGYRYNIIVMISMLIMIIIVILSFLVNIVLGCILVVLFAIICILFSRIFVNIGCGLDYELQIKNRLKNDLIVGDGCCNIRTRLILISYCIESIIIGCDSFCSVNEFVVDGLNELKLVKIGENSFSKKKNDYGNESSRSFHISNCILLESIEISCYSFSDYGGGFKLKNLPKLKSFEVGNDCFKNVKLFKFDGLNELKSLKIGMNSFTLLKSGDKWDWKKAKDAKRSFHILNCIELESIEIGRYSFCDYGGGFELFNLPKLSTIKIGEIGSNSYNFYYSSFVIQGIIDVYIANE